MSLAELFYLKETFRERVRKWRQACFHPRVARHDASFGGFANLSFNIPHSTFSKSASRFLLEALEPRLLLSATPVEAVVSQALEPAAITVPAGSLPSLDVDLNGQADALTDGIVIIRHLFGFIGDDLIKDAIDPLGQRTDPTAIATYLESIRPSLDVDLNQQADALSDGIVIIRSLFGFIETELTDGAVDLGGQRTDPAVIATFLDNMNPERELISPLVTAGLQQDTGLSSTDTITFNPTITGTIADINQIASFTAGFDTTPVANFTDILTDLLPNGTFGLSTLRLSDIFGGPLPDGTHTLHLRATDARGNLTALDRTFTVDTTAPATPTFDLALTSDTGTLGDQQTTAAIVTLKGLTDPTTSIQLVGPGTATLSNGTGTFQLPDLALAVGANAFTLRASDVAGNTSDFNRVITRLAATAQADVVLTWNQTMLEAIRLDATPPPMASRGMAMVSLAMYDTINAIEGTPGYYVSLPTQVGTSADAAAASAAHRVLSYLYPGQQTLFDTQLASSLGLVPDGPGKTNGITLGQNIADAIIAIRATDGWNDFIDYVPGNQPGDWQQTAPMFDVALLPQWADLTPFALTSPDQFTPAGPPALDSAAYATAFNEVKALGSATGSTRTADETQIARFWADGPGTYSPPGHWNQIAEQIALEQGNSLSANARLFAQLNVALADAGISAWNTKYQYEFWRPITAIQQADLDGNALTAVDSTWTSLLITPPFPEYTSGHSTFSGAAAEILASLFGPSLAFTTTSLGLPGVERSFTSFEQAAQEAGRSRIYGGIHFEFSNQDGLASGKSLAQYVVNRFTVTSDTQGPTILLNQQSGITTNTNLTLTGQVLDNLSGVAALQAKLDNGAFAPVNFSLTGTFSLPTSLALDGTADGAHTLTFQATDNQNNVSTVLFNFTLDTTAPTITFTAPIASDVLTVASRLVGTVSGTGSAITKLTYAFDGGTAMPMSIDPISGVINEPLGLSKLNIGNHTLTVTAMDAAGNSTTTNVAVSLAALIPFTVRGITPASGASDIGSTFRPQVFFSRAVNSATLNANNFYATDTTGAKLAATIVPSQDGTFAWLFFTNPMPGGETITLHVDGATILGAADGQPLDANGDGTPGGSFTSTFSTVSLIPIPGTTITGRVVDPGPDLKPMTFDDIRAGADGILHTSDDVFLNPIANAKVFIVGLESQAVFTDAQGNFTLTNVPAGNVKVAVDGRTATNAPPGIFFPEMVMDVTIEPGLPNTLMGSMGTPEEQRANEERDEVYLPRLETTILQTVSNTQSTTVGVTAKSAPDLTAQEAQNLFLTVPPNSGVGPDGQSISNVQIGISTVPPELIRDMLPQGVLQLANTITIQARGPNGEIVDRFVDPIQLTFPNVYGAAPGSKLNFYSFDHTTGRLVIEGTATVSGDGRSVTTDPGQGITKPGWHGVPPSGGQVTVPSDVPAVKSPDPTCDPVGVGLALGGLVFGGLAIAASGPIAPIVLGLTSFAFSAGDFAREFEKQNDAQRHQAIAEFSGGVIGTGLAFVPQTSPKTVSTWTNIRWGLATEGIGGRVPSIASKIGGALGVLGVVFSARDVGARILDCLSAPSASRVATLAASDGTSALDSISVFLDRQEAAGKAMSLALHKVYGQGLTEILPEFGKDVSLTLEGSSIRFLDVNGEAIKTTDGSSDLKISLSDFVRSVDVSNPEVREGLLECSLATQAMADAYSDLGDVNFYLKELQNQYAQLIVHETSEGTAVGTRAVGANYYTISDQRNDVILRGVTLDGSIKGFLASNSSFLVSTFNVSTEAFSYSFLGTPASGSPDYVLNGNKRGSVQPFIPVNLLADSDSDGLADAAEAIIGTAPGTKDSDADGMSDLAELRAGTDPLGGRALPTGVVGSVALRGEAKDVVIEGSTFSAETQTAYVATGSFGLAIVDASQFRTPTVLSQLDLAGNATDVAVDTAISIAAVASNVGGLHLVDVSDPRQPQLFQTINVQGASVEVANGVAYIGAGTQIAAYSLLTGELLFKQSLTNAVQELSLVGNRLYALTSTHLHILDVQTNALVPLGSVAVSGSPSPLERGRALFVGDGVVYVGYFTGYSIIDVSNPNAPVVTGTPPTTQLAVHDIAANGSGLAIATTSFAGQSTFAVSLYDVSNPTDVTQFITTIPIPGDSPHVALGAGIAFVAQGAAGLKVINYLPFDANRVAPTVSILPGGEDLDPVTPGFQVLEGSSVPIRAVIQDDVQVRNVELLVNGVVQRNDVAYPFDLLAVMPVIAAGASTATVQVRATDTGGNVGLSARLTLNLVPDTFGPSLIANNILEGTIVGHSFRTVRLGFSEAIDPAVFSSTAVQLITSGGLAISAENIQISRDGKQVQLTFAQQPVGDYTLRIDQAQVKDRAGNAMGAGFLDTHFTIKQFSVEWIAPTGGNWNAAANWSTGVVPIETDDVFIGVTSSPVTISSGTVTIQSLISSADLTLSAGTLILNGDSQINGTFVQSGGILGGSGKIILNGLATITGGDMRDAGTTLLNGATTISGSGFTMDGGRVLTNSGTVNWTGGTIELNSSTQAGAGTINNLVGATWLDSGTVAKTMRSIFGTAADNALALYNNAGTYTKNGTGTTSIGANVTDTGVLTVTGGTLNFSAFTNTHSAASTITVEAGATLNNSGSTQVFTGGTVTVAGTFSMNNSFAELAIAAAQVINGTGTLALANGALTGTSTLTVNTSASLTGVDMRDAGTLLLTGSTMISGAGFSMDGGRVLTNSGTVNWTGGTIELNSSTQAGAGTINNLVGATWLDSGTVTKTMRSIFGTAADNALALYNNAGTYTKNGTGTTAIGANVTDTGTLTVTGGTLNFSAFTNTHSAGSTITVEAGATLNNSGSTQVFTGGTVTVAGTFSMNNSFAELNLAAAQTINGTGTLVLGNGALTGTATLTVNTSAGLTGVDMRDAGTTLLNGATTISGSGFTMDGGRVLTNSGTVTWTAGTIELNRSGQAGAGTINNLVGAIWIDSGTVPKTLRSLFGTAADNALALFNNAGTYTKSDTGTTGLDVQVLHSGSIDVQAGTLRLGGGGTHTGSFGTTGTGVVQFGTGLHHLQAASAVTGTVLFTGFSQNGIADMTTVEGSYAATNTTVGLNSDVVFNSTGTTGTLTVTGNGRLRGAGILTVTGTHTLTAGSMMGTGQTILQGNGTISSLNLDDDRLVQIQGATTWTGSSSQRIWFNRFAAAGGGGTIATTATGIFDIQTDAVMDYFTTPVGQFTNTGLIRKTVGTGITGLDVQVLNSGTVVVPTGTLRLGGGGTHIGSFGTTGTGVVEFGRGVHQLQGVSSITGNVLFTGFSQNGIADVTTVEGSYAATNTTVGLNSDVVFNSTGTTGTLTVTGNGRLRGAGILTVTGTHTLTAGSMMGTGQTILQGNGTISSLNLDDDRLVQIQGATTWTGSSSQRIWFNRFAAAGGGGTLAVTATGIFDIQTDALMDEFFVGATGQFTNAGTIRKTLGTGTTGLDVPVLNSGTVDVQSGTLRFAGASVLTNAGAISVKPGALVSVTGGYSQTAGGSLSIEVSGILTTQFGRLTATGAATLDGTLNVSLANGFTPAVDDRFRFMTFASRTGFFAATNGLGLGGGLAFQVEQTDPLDLELVTVAVVPASSLPTLSLPSEVLVDELATTDVTAFSTSDLVTNLTTFRLDPRFNELVGQGMTAVIIDTGIDVDHPFFGPDADHNGIADRIVFQWDFADDDADASDRNGHGSHIASLIGSEDLTYPGVAPEANLIALKVFSDAGSGTFDNVEQALQWVMAHAADYSIDVVNLSLGDGQNWATPDSHYGLGDEFAALTEAGVLLIAAAGNNFFTAQSLPGVAYPAADPNVIGVGAVWTADFGGPWRWRSGAIDLTTSSDRIASFSQRDPVMTEVFAPGARLIGANHLGGTVTMQGTSQAAAYLSGTVLLAQQVAEHDLGRKLTPDEFTKLAADTGTVILDGDDEQDNVVNTGDAFSAVDVLQLAKGIHRHDDRDRGEVDRHRGEHGLALAYAQRCWVKDFVSKDSAAVGGKEEELLITLPA